MDGTEGMELGDGRFNTIDGTDSIAVSGSGTNWDKAFYDNPNTADYCYGDSIQSSYTKCGYLYNWYAATVGSGSYDSNIEGANVSESICPVGWRLPSGGDDAMSDLAILNSSMAKGSLTYPGFYEETIDYAYAGGWQYTGSWQGVMSGGQSGILFFQGQNGFYWTSTFGSLGNARVLYFHPYGVGAGAGSNAMYYGFAVRCVHPGAITINFNGNGATSGSTASQMIETGTSQNLNSNGFTRTGYKFTGWNTIAGGTGTSYGDGANYTAPANPSSYTITLYAQWEPEFTNLLTQATYMQDLSAAQCSGSSDGATATLKDRRDNNSYTIAKINGNCWMTQNLRIAGGTTLTSTYSNVSSSYTIPTTDLTTGNSYTEGRIHYSYYRLDYWQLLH